MEKSGESRENYDSPSDSFSPVDPNSHQNDRKLSKSEQIQAIDKLATAPGTTLASFAHLDEKKVLRKMDWHLLPTLTLLCELSSLHGMLYASQVITPIRDRPSLISRPW